MSKREKKVIEYTDEINDDFAETRIKQVPLGPKFKYVSKNIFFRFFGFYIYYFWCIPILWIVTKIHVGWKLKNKKVLKEVKGKGYFIYCNHTYMLDPIIHDIVNWPRRSYIIAGLDATSIKGIRWLVMMLGAIPLPDTVDNRKDFYDCIQYRIKEQKRAMVVYPEAHIWKYYTGIRPLRPATFRFPVRLDVPVVIATTTWQKRGWPWKRPRMIVNLAGPFYNKPELDELGNTDYITRTAQEVMNGFALAPGNFEYIQYKKAAPKETITKEKTK